MYFSLAASPVQGFLTQSSARLTTCPARLKPLQDSLNPASRFDFGMLQGLSAAQRGQAKKGSCRDTNPLEDGHKLPVAFAFTETSPQPQGCLTTSVNPGPYRHTVANGGRSLESL